MIVVSCDPGLTGALSLIHSERGLLACVDLPICGNGQATGSSLRWVDVEALEVILATWSSRYDFARESVHAAIERPIPMPTLPAQTVASQFDTFGVIRALLGARLGQAAMHIIAPKAWKKLFGLQADKEAARACCLRLYPTAPVSRKKDHNRADSILIGHFLVKELA